jgi:hypothetical protein
METTLSKDVQEKLDMINWDSLKDKYGISRDTFYNNPHLASQLAYGQMTDLVFASKEDFSGLLSLRANMDTSGEKPEMKVRAFTMEKPKTMADTLYLYRQPITSEAVKEALLEKGEWLGPDGKKMHGHLNANGGRPITLNIDGKRQQFLVSLHHPTNRVVGMSLDSVRSYFYDKDNNLRGRGMYGVPFTEEQVKGLIEGNAVVHSGLRKDGESFSCCVQFDAAKREPTISHPSWLKQAQKAGAEIAPKQRQEQQEKAAQQQKASQEQGQKKSGGLRK